MPIPLRRPTRFAARLLALYLIVFALTLGLGQVIAALSGGTAAWLPVGASAVFEGWGWLLLGAVGLWRGHGSAFHAIYVGTMLSLAGGRPVIPIWAGPNADSMSWVMTGYALNVALFAVEVALHWRVRYEQWVFRRQAAAQGTPYTPPRGGGGLIVAGVLLAILATLWLIGSHQPEAVRGSLVQSGRLQWRWCDVQPLKKTLQIRFARSSYQDLGLLEFESSGEFLPPPEEATLPLPNRIAFWGIEAGLGLQRLAYRRDLAYELRLPYGLVTGIAAAVFLFLLVRYFGQPKAFGERPPTGAEV